MNYFFEYRLAHDEMVDDGAVEGLRNTLKITRDALAKIEAPYRERMMRAEEGIKETVLDQQRTVALHGVEATYTKPRKTVKWKAVAQEYSPPDELIEEHTTVGHPSVRIKVQDNESSE